MAEITTAILADIKAAKTQKDCAFVYARAMGLPSIDWKAVNLTILERWRLSGLKRIKKQAWGMSANG